MNKLSKKLKELKKLKSAKSADNTPLPNHPSIGIKKRKLRNDIIGLTVLGLSAFTVALYFGRGLLGAEEGTMATPTTPTMTSVSTVEDFPAGVASVRITVTTDIPATCAIGTALSPTANMTTTGGTTHTEIIPTTGTGSHSRFIRCRAGVEGNWGAWSNEEVATARIIPQMATNGTIMQEVTLDSCPTERVWVVDARDNRTYWIRRIPNTASGGTGDLCWMETNLAYGGGGTTTHGDTMDLTVRNAGAGAWDVAPANSIPFVRTDNTGSISTPTPLFTTAPTPPSLTVQTANDSPVQRGFLYNWCAAMGGPTGNAQACNTTQSSQPLIHQTPNPGTGHNQNTTICPKNWRLPRTTTLGSSTQVNDNTNEFWNLNQTQNNGLTNTDSLLRTNWLGVRAGSVNSTTGGFVNVGTQGVYWSSTVLNAANAHILLFLATLVSPANNCNKAQGCSVRCVLD